MQIFRIVLLAGLLIVLVFSPAKAENIPSLFDKPLYEQHLPLPSDPINSQQKATLSCFYYDHLMVKQIDMGEVGAEQLSMIYFPENKKEPPCRKENAEDEKIIDWSGYFKGVKGEYVFFDTEDGSNGGRGFGVFNVSNNREIFADNGVEIHSIKLMSPLTDPGQRPWYENPITIRYQRAYLAPCSLRTDEKNCWDIIKLSTGLTNQHPPNCNAAYEAEEKRVPTGQVKQTAADPSVITYEAELCSMMQALYA